MDVSGIASSALANVSQSDTTDAVQLAVLKIALAIEGQGALQLVLSATQTSYNNPPNLGNSIDTIA